MPHFKSSISSRNMNVQSCNNMWRSRYPSIVQKLKGLLVQPQSATRCWCWWRAARHATASSTGLATCLQLSCQFPHTWTKIHLSWQTPPHRLKTDTKTLQEQLVSTDKNSYCGHRMTTKDLSFPLVAETHLQQENAVNWLKWELINPQNPPTLHWNQNSWLWRLETFKLH